jgi:hypothetical protein
MMNPKEIVNGDFYTWGFLSVPVDSQDKTTGDKFGISIRTVVSAVKVPYTSWAF